MSFEVVIVGGGIAALEGALALRALAGERVNLTLVSPRADFVLTPLAVGEPFSVARAPKRPIAEIAHELGARHVPAAVTRVLPEAKLIELSTAVSWPTMRCCWPPARARPRRWTGR